MRNAYIYFNDNFFQKRSFFLKNDRIKTVAYRFIKTIVFQNATIVFENDRKTIVFKIIFNND